MFYQRKYFINQNTQFNSISDLISHYHHYPLNDATGSKLVKPVGAPEPQRTPAENGEYVEMVKPGQLTYHLPLLAYSRGHLADLP